MIHQAGTGHPAIYRYKSHIRGFAGGFCKKLPLKILGPPRFLNLPKWMFDISMNISYVSNSFRVLSHIWDTTDMKVSFNLWRCLVQTKTLAYHLVGGLEHFLISHILGILIPLDFHIFQRCGSTTNQFWFLNLRVLQPGYDMTSGQLHGRKLLHGP